MKKVLVMITFLFISLSMLLPAQSIDGVYDYPVKPGTKEWYELKTEEERIDFMFRVIQYVERQVVLYDSVEDSAFSQLIKQENNLSLLDYIHLINNKSNKNELLQKLSTFCTRIVFTAHPTQFYSPSVLDIISRLRIFIAKNDINEIDILLQQLGLTSLINSKKPTPFDEAKNIIYFLRDVYYDAVIELYSEIKKNLQEISFDNTNIIQFGFWPGGDRDGNPFVTADITNKVADELRMTLMKCYYSDLKKLEQKLSFRSVEEEIKNLRDRIYLLMFDSSKSIRYSEILISLDIIKKSLVNDYNSLYLEELESLIDKVKIFKTHFASLDIRQNHSIHKQAILEILKQARLISNSLEELSKDDLIDILLNKEIKIRINEIENELVIDTIENIAQLKLLQDKNGEEGCNRYIISNSEDIYSVLFVFALLRWFGWQTNNIPMDIIPLFESIDGMANSGAIMEELFKIPEYKGHISQRDNFQTIMLGFSDGTKDGGYLQANWSIFKTKEILTLVCKQNNIKVIFFDGRGGPPARGGGKTHRFYAAQSDRIANNAIQITIQGQTITSKFGTKEHFKHNSEQLLTAGLSHSLFEKGNTISDESREIIDDLAKLSFNKYTELKNHEMFIPYLENKSTLKYYGDTNIGSRPTKRGDSKKLDLKDLRAIPFVGSWSQLKQNIPGYFGLGTALKKLLDEGKVSKLQLLFEEVQFFRALILNSMMSLNKCNFNLTSYITEDEAFKDFWNILFEEYKLSKEMVLLISQYNILMEEEPVSRSSIEIREKIVLPLLVIQQSALQKIEEESNYKNSYEKIVKRSLYGNINASRNSA